MIGNGYFTNDHPIFPGMEWWGIKHISKDKGRKLGLHTLHVKETEDDIGKFPVLSDGKKGDVRNDIGGAIKRFMSLLPESVKNNRFYKRVTKDNLFFANQVLGKNTIRNRFRSAFERMGIERFDTIKPKGLIQLNLKV